MKLLHLDASPRGERSRSREIGAAFLAALARRHAALAVEHLDPWTADLPSVDGALIEARYALIAGEPVPATTADAWARVGAIARHLLGFDVWLITTPMWNFGVPYRLKHYIDVVTHPGFLFTNTATAVTGLAAGRRAVFIGASAMPNEALTALDHQLAYLTAWARFVGVEEVHTVRVAPTYGDAVTVGAAVARARTRAEQVAALL